MFKNFDFSWFLTTPGILTGIGCLLIIISIIIFISSAKGNSKKNKDNVEVSEASIPDVNPVNAGTEPINFAKTMEPLPIENNQVENVPVTPVAPAPVEPVNVEPQVAPVQPIIIEPQVTPVQPISVEPQITPVQPISIEPQITPANPTYGGVNQMAAPGVMPSVNQTSSQSDEIESL